MLCPKCQMGNIRVMAGFVCACGNPSFVCDGCYQEFSVPCGMEAMPPDVPLGPSDNLRKGYEELVRRVGPNAQQQSYEDMMRQSLIDDPDEFPLLDDYKASLAES